MSQINDLATFLHRNQVSQIDWEKSCLSFDTLKRIAQDHEENKDDLLNTAELVAKTLQRLLCVHSVRYRIKDTEHLLAKIIRKAAEGDEVYGNVDSQNYFTVVSDLVGVRALHLFKDDWLDIHNELAKKWRQHEKPIAYIREGDNSSEHFINTGLQVKQHPDGYRSIHYVFSIKPIRREVLFEIQVRTVFEEGWSEIDHKVRYPKGSRHQMVDFFLAIFSRFAGSADEMGTFVKGLDLRLAEQKTVIDTAVLEKDEALAKMANALESLSKAREQGHAEKREIEALRAEIIKLKTLNFSSSGLLGTPLAMENLLGIGDQSWSNRFQISPIGNVVRLQQSSATSENLIIAGSNLETPKVGIRLR